MGLTEFEIPGWEYKREVLLKSSLIILLFSFIEYALKSICLYLSETKGNLKIKNNISKSKIDNYLDIISDCINDNLGLSDLCTIRIQTGRRLKNLFAHGDWDNIWIELKQSPLLKDYVDIVVEILF